MHPDTLRRIDKWVGVPLCLLLTPFAWLGRILRRKKAAHRRILFIELSEMGSTILAAPAMKEARRVHHAELFFLIFKENAASVDVLGIIPKHNVLTIRSSNLFVFAWDTLRVLWRIRRWRIDTVIDLELFSRFTSILTLLSGARTTVGFHKYHMEGLYRGNWLTHPVPYNPHLHISQSFHALVRAMALDPAERPLPKIPINEKDVTSHRVTSTPAKKKAILARLKRAYPGLTTKHRIVLLNPNASELLPIRKWPLHNYVALARALLKDDSIVIGIIGVLSERPDATAIITAVKDGRCFDLTGTTTLPELLTLFSVSSLLISNDSGPPHFASLTGLPTIVFFGPETPALYKPLGPQVVPLYAHYACSPCVSAFNHRKTSCTRARCLEAITVKQAHETALRLLRGKR